MTFQAILGLKSKVIKSPSVVIYLPSQSLGHSVPSPNGVKNPKPIPSVQRPENKALDDEKSLVALNKKIGDLQRTSEPKEPARSNKNQDKIKSSEEKDPPVSNNVPEIKNKYIPQTCFIWIEKKGYLGFSNMQYNEKNLKYIYIQEKWKRPQWVECKMQAGR